MVVEVLFFMFLALAGWWLFKWLVDGWFYWIFIALVFLYVKNIDVMTSSPPGAVGTVLNTAIIGKQTDETYRSCLKGYVQAEPGNPGLQSAAGLCDTQREAGFWACMAKVKRDFPMLNKEAHCATGAAKKVWTPCAEKALSLHAVHFTAIPNCVQGKTIEVIRDFVGSQSGQTP